MNYYDAFCLEVSTTLGRHMERILGSYRREEVRQIIQEAMKDLQRIFRDYGVDWKLGEKAETVGHAR